MRKVDVAILMGSDSDLAVVQPAIQTLEKFGVPFDVMVNSAHRSPESVRTFALAARKNGIKVLIAAAGGAAHLAGVLAAHTTLPVIGIPIPTKELGGMDSLLSTVQMPSGIPVATVGINKAGAANAGILAVQMLAIGNTELAGKLLEYKAELADKVKEKNEKLKEKL